MRQSRLRHACATTLPALTLPVPNPRRDIEKKGLQEFEVAQLGNLLPDSADEAKALIPSLVSSDITQEQLSDMLDQLKE